MKNKELNLKESILVGAFIIVTVFLFLGLTGTINSGLHLVDDHEFYVIRERLENGGFLSAYVNTVKSDMTSRFRPLYYFFRVVGVCMFGTNAVAWSICKGIEISLCMLFLYMFARMLNINPFFSAMFGILTLLGEQSAVWWRLGPQESLGMLLFSMAMLVTYFLSKERKVLFVFLYIVILAVLSLYKESFFVSMPAFFGLLLALESRWMPKNLDWKTIISKFCRNHLLEIIVLAIFLLIEAYIIVFNVGTDKVSYAGFHSDTSLMEYIIGILVNFKHWCFPYLLMGIGALLLVQIEIKKEDFSKTLLLDLLFVFILFATEQICYAKSNMWERYLLPWVISVLYFIIIDICGILKRNKRVEIAMGGMLLLFAAYFSSKAVPSAIDFTQKGRDLWKCVEYVVDNTENENSLIAVTRIPEEDAAFCQIFYYEYNYHNCEVIAKYEDNIQDIQNADILIGKRGQVYYRISEEAKLSLGDYNFFETENYEVGIKKDI